MIGKQIGSGGTSNVYEWGCNEVIKLYKPHVTEDVIRNESYIGALLNQFSLDIPEYRNSIDYNGKTALIYERIHGSVLAEPMLHGIYEEQAADLFAKKHIKIHQKEIVELPSQYDFLKNRIMELSTQLGDKSEALLCLLDSIPKDHKLCHGDYQPLNIIVDADNYIVIDWNGACSGSPNLDVAWTYMTINSPAIKQVLGVTISDVFYKFAQDYLASYCKQAEIYEHQILRCLPIVAARRLYDNNQHENEISKVERAWLHSLIDGLTS